MPRMLAPLSVLQKIVLLTCGMTLVACLLVGGYTFSRLYGTSTDMAMDGLRAEGEMVALRFQESFMQMANDAFILRHTPPIQGIIRSQETGTDPQDGSTGILWRERLGTIFTSLMQPRTHYTQMRYIGLNDGGRELVRVNRTKSGLQVVPQRDLQQKEMEPYFQDSLDLKAGEVLFSDITYNREHGEVDISSTPTLRAITPIFDGSRLFGMIVINSHFQHLLEQAFKAAAPNYPMLVVNHAGDYATYDPETQSVKLSLREDTGYTPPPFMQDIKNTLESRQLFEKDGLVSAFIKLPLNPSDPDSFLGILLQTPKTSLFANAYKTQAEVLSLTVVIILASLLVAGLVAQRLLLPLQRMTRSIATTTSGKPDDLDLPMGQPNEIGDLARAFYQLTSNLQKSEVKARGVDSLVDGVVTINQRGMVESFNPACEKIFGYKAQEIIGRSVNCLMPKHDGQRHNAYMHRYNNTGKSNIIGVGREVTGLRSDGTEFPMELSVSETYTENGLIFTGVVRDITDRKQVERMKDEFISTVNHELRTPLTSIQGSLGLLQAQAGSSLNDRARRLLEISYDNCSRLTHLVNDILDIEKIAAGKMDYLLENVDLCSLTADVVERHRTLEEAFGIRFKVQLPKKEILCQVDGNRYNQALTNLLSNAAKFSPPGGVVVIHAQLEDDGQVLVVSVTDQGPGIPKEFRGKIFTKFAQADSSSTRSKGGSGLGLNITKSIIEAFGGTISFESVVGQGTTFRLWLPVIDTPSDPFKPTTQRKEAPL